MKPERVTAGASATPEQPPQIAGAILPLDLIVETLSYLTPKDGWLASQTCRWWWQLLKQDPRLRAQVERNLPPHLRLAEYKAIPNADWAAEHGYLEVLQWLQAHDYSWSEKTCAAAAGDGHLLVLQWLRKSGCPWDEDTCACAVLGGHLEVLQWARANSCPWDPGLCVCWASVAGKHEIMHWVSSQMA